MAISFSLEHTKFRAQKFRKNVGRNLQCTILVERHCRYDVPCEAGQAEAELAQHCAAVTIFIFILFSMGRCGRHPSLTERRP